MYTLSTRNTLLFYTEILHPKSTIDRLTQCIHMTSKIKQHTCTPTWSHSFLLPGRLEALRNKLQIKPNDKTI